MHRPVVHQDVDATKPVERDLGHGITAGNGGQVAQSGHHGGALCRQVLGHLLEPCRVAAMHDDRYAFVGEHLGNADTDARATSGYECPLSLQLKIHGRPP